MKEVREILEKLEIEYKIEEHDIVMTCEEANNLNLSIKGAGVKNLFLKTKKGAYYLYILPEAKRADMKILADELSLDKLSFASSDRLMEVLKLEPGSVTPMGLINDETGVVLIIDNELVDQTLLIHPNTNRATMQIEYIDLLKLVKQLGNE